MKEITIEQNEQFILKIKGIMRDKIEKYFLVNIHNVKYVYNWVGLGSIDQKEFIIEIELQTKQIRLQWKQ